jgi:hypothetical protein
MLRYFILIETLGLGPRDCIAGSPFGRPFLKVKAPEPEKRGRKVKIPCPCKTQGDY